MHIITPDTDELWNAYLECRYRNLYAPFELPRTCTTSELDTPRVRPEILHRVAAFDASDTRIVAAAQSATSVIRVGEIIVGAAGRLDLQLNHPKGPSAQLRYFAVDTALRGLGAGQALLRHLEDQARVAGCTRLWMEARCAALNFYQREGYVDVGEGPMKWGVIPHRILEKARL